MHICINIVGNTQVYAYIMHIFLCRVCVYYEYTYRMLWYASLCVDPHIRIYLFGNLRICIEIRNDMMRSLRMFVRRIRMTMRSLRIIRVRVYAYM
jgi:hypothetical protein